MSRRISRGKRAYLLKVVSACLAAECGLCAYRIGPETLALWHAAPATDTLVAGTGMVSQKDFDDILTSMASAFEAMSA